MADKILGTNIEVQGNIKVLTVPNNTGTVVTYNASTQLLSTRTNTQILADLGLTSVVSNSHNPLSLGTANGLTLNASTQVLSLGLAGTNSVGALSSTDWNIFNNKFALPSGGTANHYLNGLGNWALFPTLQNLTAGNHIDITSNAISVQFDINTYVTDKAGNPRLYFGDTSPGNDMILRLAQSNGQFSFRNSANNTFGFLHTTNGWNLSTGNYSVGSQSGSAVQRDMGTQTGGWARYLYALTTGGNAIDYIGHFGNAASLNYGFIGGTAYNTKNAIRWGANGNVGIGYYSTTSNFDYQLKVRSDDYVSTFLQNNSAGSSQGSAIGFGNVNSTTGYFGDVGFGVTNNDFTVRNATGDTLFKINQSNNVPSFPNLPGVQTGTTGNLAYINSIGEIWRHQLTIGDLITTSNIGNYTQTLNVPAYGVNANTGGAIGISNGGIVNLPSVGRNNLIDFNDLSNFGAGLFPIANTTGSVNYPSGFGAGIVSVRNTANNSGGNFALWTSESNVNELMVNISGTSGWFGWQKLITDTNISSYIPTVNDYMTTNTNQTTLTGTKYSTGTWYFALRQSTWYNDTSGNSRLYFGPGTNTNGVLIGLTNTTERFQIRDNANTQLFQVYGDGTVIGSTFAGTGSRMVVAEASGRLTTQSIPNIPGVNDYWTTNTTQIGLTGDKTTNGILTFNGTQANSLRVIRNSGLINSSMSFGFQNTDNVWIGAADTGTFAIGLVDANIANTSRQRLYVNATSVGTADLPGSYIQGRDQGGFTVEKVSSSAGWSSILRHKFTNADKTFGLGGIHTSSGNMSSWGMFNWNNSDTINQLPAFFGWAGSTDQLRASSLEGIGTEMVVAGPNGALSRQAIPTGNPGTVTNVSSTVAGTALNVNVTNSTSTPALAFTWSSNSTQLVRGDGGLRPASDFALASSIITPNNGQLTLSTGTGLAGAATFTADQSGNSAFNVSIASGYVLPTTAQWNALSTQTLVSSTSNIIVSNSVQRAALTGDVTAAQNSNVTTLSNTGVTAGTYNSVQVDVKGRVIGASNQPYTTNAQVVNTVNNMMQPLIDGVTRYVATGSMNIPIDTRKTIVTLDKGVINIDLDIDDGKYDGYELAINGCGEWSATLHGRIINKCNEENDIPIGGTSVLFWWNGADGRWEQAI